MDVEIHAERQTDADAVRRINEEAFGRPDEARLVDALHDVPGRLSFVAVADGKGSIVVGVTDDLTSRVNAVDLVRLGSEALGGKGGGGRADMAQAGGPDGAKAGDAIAAIEKRLSSLAPA